MGWKRWSIGVMVVAGLLVSPWTTAQPLVRMPVPYSSVAELPVAAIPEISAYGDDPEQTLAFFPANPKTAGASGKVPVVLVHGGCWAAEYTREHTYPLAEALAQRGHAVWVPEYRRVGNPGGGWPGSFRDVTAALRAVSDVVDGQPLALIGHSAGGHLALLAGVRSRAPDQEPVPLAGLIGLAAITDPVRYAAGSNSCQTMTSQFMGGTPASSRPAYLLATPAGREFRAPVYLLWGEADPIVPKDQLLNIDAASVYLIEGAAHFDLIHPKTEAFNALLDALAKIDG